MRSKKILVICKDDASPHNVTYDIIRYLVNVGEDDLSFLVIDKNKKILNFLRKKKANYIKIPFKLFLKKIKKNDYDWLVSIWSPLIYKKNFLDKFKFNLNIHPSYLPYNRGKDPYIWSIINETPFGATIHQMNHKIDDGRFYARQAFKLEFPYTGQTIYDSSLILIKKLFFSKWKKIKNKIILPKKYHHKTKLNYRKLLRKINILNLDQIKNKSIKYFILQCLAQDFKYFKQQIKYKKKIYDVKINLKLVKKVNKF